MDLAQQLVAQTKGDFVPERRLQAERRAEEPWRKRRWTKIHNHDRELATAQDKASLAKTERSIKSILDAIEDGRYERSMLDRLDDLERQKDQIEARLAKAPPPLPRIHPNIAEVYRTKLQLLEGALVRPDDAREAAEAMRALIEKIVLTPGAKRGKVKAEMQHGELAAILALTSGQKPRTALDDGDMRFSVVPGGCNTLYALLS